MTPRAAYVALLAFLAVLLRLLRRSRRGEQHDPLGAAPLGAAPPGSTTVRTEDGVTLHAELDGPADAPLTVVFVHGFTARLGEFELQRETLQDRARMVLYDHRGHGRSRRGRVKRATIDQLGRDLGAVLEQVTPPGPVGLLLKVLRTLHLLRPWLLGLRLWSPALETVRRPGTKLGRAYIRHYLFGTDDADPELVTRVQDLLEETPLTVTASYYATLIEHDEVASLDVLRRVPVTVLVGDADRLTPASHSRLMADALGDAAELIVVPGAGHSVNITRRAVVDDALLRLLDRVQAAQRRTA